MEVRVSDRLMCGLLLVGEETRISTIRWLVEVYGCRCNFGVSDAMMLFEVEMKIPLPFTGIARDCCGGLKKNHGLLSQCEKEKVKGVYCEGCQKQADKNASGKPNFGNIEDRMAAFEAGKEYRDPKGKGPIAYGKVMQKLKLTVEQVKMAAAKQMIELSSDIFNTPVAKRGRPKKNPAVVSDTESDIEQSSSKKRGRPKKTGKPIEVSTTEDLFATIISEAKAQSPLVPPLPKPEELQEPEEEKEVKVKKFEFKGKLYYRTADNLLYDPKTSDCMGVFNEERQEIDECEEEEEDDDV